MIFLACLLTILVETPFLMVFGFRSKDAVIVIVCANTISNLLLNLVLLWFPWLYAPLTLALLEFTAAAFECSVYSAAFGFSRRLLFLTAAANALSLFAGTLFFSIYLI
ncbi:MAG: hypothetical protein J5855_02035 [Mailhella sp.]|nr:hypothetical protein [Mailhella sp.]